MGLSRLWALADRVAAERNTEAGEVFGAVGLYLAPRLETTDYEATPKNARTFAWTGVDGIHFSLLFVDGRVQDTSPVVMTVPGMFGSENLVVGQDLGDFLALGAMAGFDLEGLVDEDDKPTIERIESSRERDPLLATLARELALSPWRDIRRHLEELKTRFGPSARS